MAFDVVVRAFFTDSGLSAGLERANARLHELGRSGPGAAAGLRAAEMGARALAFQAVGMAGPLEKVSSGLLQLGGGSAGLLSAVVGLAAVGVAIRALTQDARDNAKAQQEMQKSLQQLGPHGEVAAARVELARLQQMRDTPTLVQRAERFGKGFLGPVLGGASLAEQDQELDRQIAHQRAIIARAGRDAEKPGASAEAGAALALREAQARSRIESNARDIDRPATVTEVAEAVRRLRLEEDVHTRSVAAATAAMERHAAELNLDTDAVVAGREAITEAQIRLDMAGQSEAAVTEAIRRHKLELTGMSAAAAAYQASQERIAFVSELVGKAQDSANDALEVAKIRTQHLTASEEDVTRAIRIHQLVQQGMSTAQATNIATTEGQAAAHVKTAGVLRTQLPQAFAAMATAARTSMAAVAQSAVASATSIVQSLPGVTPVLGGVLGVVSSLFSSLFGSNGPGLLIAGYTPAALAQLREVQGSGTLVAINSTGGADIATTQYLLARRSRQDAIPRIPVTTPGPGTS